MNPSPPKETREHALLKRDADRNAFRRGEVRVLLADELVTVVVEIERQDRAGVRRRERDLGLAVPRCVNTVMNRLSPVSHALAGADQQVHEARALLLTRASPKIVVISMAVSLYIERAGLGDGALAGIELDLDELHLVAAG